MTESFPKCCPEEKNKPKQESKIAVPLNTSRGVTFFFLYHLDTHKPYTDYSYKMCYLEKEIEYCLENYQVQNRVQYMDYESKFLPSGVAMTT